MVELFEQDIKTNDRQSSKGNQLKWKNNSVWYKADYTGYEGLSEYVVSRLLLHSSLEEKEFIIYDTEEIKYKKISYLGCCSNNFLPEGWKLITLERLFQSFYNVGLNKSIYEIDGVKNRIEFLVEQTERITGLKKFGNYISKLITIDALFLNEDRHTHNIAVLVDDIDEFHYCPIFDNGASLLSDTTMDYPMNTEVPILISEVKSRTFCNDFEEQLEAVEELYGQNVKFQFTVKDIEDILAQECYYPEAVKSRVKEIVLEQKRKYNYLF